MTQQTLQEVTEDFYGDQLAGFLSYLAETIDKDPRSWSSKYGTTMNTAIFSMHEYCWCEKEDCPWCGPGCDCPREAWRYYVDGVETSYEDWMDFFDDLTGGWRPLAQERDAWMAAAQEANRRRTTIHTPTCEFCTIGWGCEYGGVPGKRAPNFWHKPTDFKVWWYKYIGRGMETEGPMPEDWEALLKECLESIP